MNFDIRKMWIFYRKHLFDDFSIEIISRWYNRPISWLISLLNKECLYSFKEITRI